MIFADIQTKWDSHTVQLTQCSHKDKITTEPLCVSSFNLLSHTLQGQKKGSLPFSIICCHNTDWLAFKITYRVTKSFYQVQADDKTGDQVIVNGKIFEVLFKTFGYWPLTTSCVGKKGKEKKIRHHFNNIDTSYFFCEISSNFLH